MSRELKRKHPASSSARASKGRKNDKNSDDEISNTSSGSGVGNDQERSSSPFDDDTVERLPEVLLQTLYKKPGNLMIAGMVSWDMVGRRDTVPSKKSHPNLYTFHRFTDQKYRLIVSSCSASHSVLISDKGLPYTFGRNQFGQLGHGDTEIRDEPKLVEQFKNMNIIDAATGRNHTLFLNDKGIVYACGDNRCGQLGLGNTSPFVPTPTRIKYKGHPVVKVGCGGEFSMILDCHGVLHSFGSPEYGQLGHNTGGKYFVTSTKMSFHYQTVPKPVVHYFKKTKDGLVFPVKDVVVVSFACGNNHTVVIDSTKRAFSWGFGGFGRLGHNEPKDEAVPRLIRFFDSNLRGVRSVHCGATYTLAVNDMGALYMFGQNKRTGEANMYPKPVQDLSGWNIRSVGTSNTSIVISADESLIAWGVSPTYGELGIGELNKSTSRPREVNKMDGLDITQVTMGYSHTLLLCDVSKEEVKNKLETFPVFTPRPKSPTVPVV